MICFVDSIVFIHVLTGLLVLDRFSGAFLSEEKQNKMLNFKSSLVLPSFISILELKGQVLG